MEWTPRPLVEHLREQERYNVTVITVGSKYEVYVRSPASSHMQTLKQPFQTLAIKWEVNIIVKKSFLRLYHAFSFLRLYCCVAVDDYIRTGPPPPPTWSRWTTSFSHTSRTSLTWPPTTPKPASSPPSAVYSPSSRRRLWKRHTPSSRSVSRRWLRLKAAALNRCQLYYIIKLPELIFFNKSFKIKL